MAIGYGLDCQDERPCRDAFRSANYTRSKGVKCRLPIREAFILLHVAFNSVSQPLAAASQC